MSGPAGSNSFAGAPAITLETGDTVTCAVTNLATMTKETGEPIQSGGSPTQTAWWTFTAPSAGEYSFDTLLSDSSADTTVAVYRGSSLGSLTLVAYNDDDTDGLSNAVALLAAGSTYHVQVTPYSNGAAGAVILRTSLVSALPDPTPPTGGQGSDYFVYATPIPYGGSSVVTPSADLTLEPDEPGLTGTSPINRTAWWTFTAPATETVGVDLLGSEYTASYASTVVNVYTGSSLGTLTLVAAGVYNTRPGFGSLPYTYLTEFDFEATAGTTYYVQVGLYTSSPDLGYVLRLGRRVAVYSDWSEADDYTVTYSPSFTKSRWYHQEIQSITGATNASAQALLNSMLADTVNHQADTAASGSTPHGFKTSISSSGAHDGSITVWFWAEAYFPNPGEPAFDMTLNGGPAPDTTQWVEWENGRQISYVEAAVITKLWGSWDAKSTVFLHKFNSMVGSLPFHVLPGSVWDEPGGTFGGNWPLDDARKLLDVPFPTDPAVNPGNFFPAHGPLDITDEVTDGGAFIWANFRPATVTTGYSYISESVSTVEISVWPLEMEYTFRPARWRYVETYEIDGGGVATGVLKVKVDAAGATEIDRWQTWGFPNETAGAGKVLASDGWHVADDDAATVSGHLKIKVDATTWADVSWMTPE